MNHDLPLPIVPDQRPDSPEQEPTPRRARRHTFLRALLFAMALAAAIGATVTRDIHGIPLRLGTPVAQSQEFVTRIDALTRQIMDNDVAMRAVLSHHTRALDAQPVQRSLSTLRQLLQAAITELRDQRHNERVPHQFTDSHTRLLAATTLLNQHYEALQKAISAKNAQDQQQSLLAAQSLDTQYAQALMAYLKSYQDNLRQAGFVLKEAPR